MQPENPLWYRVAGLTPRLASHAQIQRQTLRGEVEHVLHNRISGRFFRLSGSAYHFTVSMNGERSVQELCDATNQRFGDAALSQDQAIELLGKLYSAELLSSDTHTDVSELLRRDQRSRRGSLQARLKNPLAIKLPLFDPDRLLNSLLPLGRIIFSRAGFSLWFFAVLSGLMLAIMHWDELANDAGIQLLSPQNLLLLAIGYPLIKIVHETAHGLATKVWGGQVHETGLILMALMPLPYVDASSASLFPEKKYRILVGAAGIMAELLIAALALMLWLQVEPGLVRSLAYNLMLIGGISTLLFNGNPLLRFDGYYILSDLAGIPNLATNSTRYLGYLVQRYLFGASQLVSPATAPDQRVWLATYGLLSFCYRLFILSVIILFVAERYPVVGLLIAVWATVTLIIMPIIKQSGFIMTSPRLQRCRARAVSASTVLVLLAAALLFAVPLPLSTMAEGVVTPPEKSELRADGEAVIVRLLAVPDSQVEKGQPLIETEDPFLTSEIRILEARLRELSIKRDEQQTKYQHVKAVMLEQDIALLQADLKDARERELALLIRSPMDGIFLVEQPVDMPGRFVSRGERLGYVADLRQPVARVPVSQADIGMLRKGIESVDIRLAENPGRLMAATISREVPAAVDRLPSPVLGPAGGGSFAVDPADKDGVRLMESVFEVELILPIALSRLGERVYVRFYHGDEPLAQQWYRRLRQLFLRKFNV